MPVPSKPGILSGRFLSAITYAKLTPSRPPLILVGMHRSGTSLLAKILEASGVLMGAQQSRSKTESILFRDINTSALELMGQSWRCTELFPSQEDLLSNYGWLRARIETQLRGGLLPQYLGPAGVVRMLRDRDSRWGWKDPRTSLLLPVWSQIFPDATLVHIVRNGLDVALSLLVREAKREGKSIENVTQDQIDRFVADLQVWEFYLARIRQSIPLFRAVYTVKYEDLLADPRRELKRFFRAIDLQPSKIIDPASMIDSSRAFRTRSSRLSWLDSLNIDSPSLSALGYQ